MRIGIITMHFPENYGAVLQSYALQKYISQFSDVEIINYIHNKKEIITSKDNITLFLKIKNVIINREEYFEKKKKTRKFKEFRKRNLNLSKKQYYGDKDIFSTPPQYDKYISGSDQIWNTDITNNSAAYYLGFIESSNKFSYASSFGHTELGNKECEFVKRYLSLYKKITIREKESAKVVSRILNKPIMVMTDPVFLLSATEWKRIIKPIRWLRNKEFIFVYSMQYNQSMIKTVKATEKFGLPMVVVNGGGTEIKYGGREIKGCGPEEFLWLIYSAKYIITNSFHGTAFSLIFGKKVLVCEHTTRNLRIEELLTLSCSADMQIKEDNTSDIIRQKIIDGQEAYEMIDIEKGKLYIQEIIRDGK